MTSVKTARLVGSVKSQKRQMKRNIPVLTAYAHNASVGPSLYKSFILMGLERTYRQMPV